ncbi:MAG TPA: hypothetical protein VNI55_05970 [Gaiellaceae bacterium]|nr:hypothetical protein [Gaiellaceae bacterium]
MVRRILALTSLALVAAFVLGAAPASASHAWSNYHWARTANPFTLKVVDSNTPDWDDNQAGAISDWSKSTVMDLTREAGDDSFKTRKRCVMISGKIHSCNATYGNNGWLGLASINISGGHITQGSAKMNDTYFNSGSYNETARQHVMCQEIGHDFGLTHQSESGADLNTCMDYADALDNPSPNAHDYDQLQTIYSHLDSSTTIGASLGTLPDAVPSWAPATQRARSVYVDQLADGSELVTFVLWANPIHAWR